MYTLFIMKMEDENMKTRKLVAAMLTATCLLGNSVIAFAQTEED